MVDQVVDERVRRACPMCGEMILEVARKCRWCGELLDPEPEPEMELEEENPEDRLEEWWRPVMWVAVFVPFLGSLFVVIAASFMCRQWVRERLLKKAEAMNRLGTQAVLGGLVYGIVVLIAYWGLGKAVSLWAGL